MCFFSKWRKLNSWEVLRKKHVQTPHWKHANTCRSNFDWRYCRCRLSFIWFLRRVPQGIYLKKKKKRENWIQTTVEKHDLSCLFFYIFFLHIIIFFRFHFLTTSFSIHLNASSTWYAQSRCFLYWIVDITIRKGKKTCREVKLKWSLN